MSEDGWIMLALLGVVALLIVFGIVCALSMNGVLR